MNRLNCPTLFLVLLVALLVFVPAGMVTAQGSDTAPVVVIIGGGQTTPSDPGGTPTPNATPTETATPTQTATATVPAVSELPETGTPASHSVVSATLLTMMAAGTFMVGGALLASRLRAHKA